MNDKIWVVYFLGTYLLLSYQNSYENMHCLQFTPCLSSSLSLTLCQHHLAARNCKSLSASRPGMGLASSLEVTADSSLLNTLYTEFWPRNRSKKKNDLPENLKPISQIWTTIKQILFIHIKHDKVAEEVGWWWG